MIDAERPTDYDNSTDKDLSYFGKKQSVITEKSLQSPSTTTKFNFNEIITEEKEIDDKEQSSLSPLKKVKKTPLFSPYMSSKIDKAFTYMSKLEEKANKEEK